MKGYIYKLSTDNLCYYGSTIQKVNNNYENKEEITTRERFYIENNTCINKTIPLQTRREWYNKNKDLIKEKRIKKFKETGKW